LLAFAGMTLRGLVAGNPVEMILWRAWIGLMIGVVLGMLLAHVGLKVVADNLPDEPDETETQSNANDEAVKAA